MKNYLVTVWILISSGALLGCAGVSPNSLKKVSNSRYLELKAPFAYLSEVAPFGAQTEYTIAAGVYKSSLEDEKGAYFEGPSKCLTSKLLSAGLLMRPDMVNKVLQVVDCGIYIPTDSSLASKIYFVAGSESVGNSTGPIIVASGSTPVQAGVNSGIATGVVAGILAAEHGNIVISKVQPSVNRLREAIIFVDR